MKHTKSYSFRKFLNDLHLWLGIASALVLFVVCLTGTIYTFKSEIQQFMGSDMYKVKELRSEKLSFEELKLSVEKSYESTVTRATITHGEKDPIVFSVAAKEKGSRGQNVYVNPYTGEVMGQGAGPGKDFFGVVFKLHRWLLLDAKIGRPIVGIATLIFVFLCISGLVLWFPKKLKGWKSIKPGFKIKMTRNWKRGHHDLHNTLGFYSLLLCLVMALTGLCWSFVWYKDTLSFVIGAKVFGGRGKNSLESKRIDESKSIGFNEALKVANAQLNYEARKVTVSFPKDDKGVFEVGKNALDRWNETVFDKVYIDQYSGKVLKEELHVNKRLSEKIAGSIKGLHLGDIYGI